MAATRFESCTANIKRLLQGTSALKISAIVTEQYPDGLGPTIQPIMDDGKHAHLVTKMEFDAGKNATFNDMLKTLHAKTVILCGIETHICVAQGHPCCSTTLTSGWRATPCARAPRPTSRAGLH